MRTECSFISLPVCVFLPLRPERWRIVCVLTRHSAQFKQPLTGLANWAANCRKLGSINIKKPCEGLSPGKQHLLWSSQTRCSVQCSKLPCLVQQLVFVFSSVFLVFTFWEMNIANGNWLFLHSASESIRACFLRRSKKTDEHKYYLHLVTNSVCYGSFQQNLNKRHWKALLWKAKQTFVIVLIFIKVPYALQPISGWLI